MICRTDPVNTTSQSHHHDPGQGCSVGEWQSQGTCSPGTGCCPRPWPAASCTWPPPVGSCTPASPWSWGCSSSAPPWSSSWWSCSGLGEDTPSHKSWAPPARLIDWVLLFIEKVCDKDNYRGGISEAEVFNMMNHDIQWVLSIGYGQFHSTTNTTTAGLPLVTFGFWNDEVKQ